MSGARGCPREAAETSGARGSSRIPLPGVRVNQRFQGRLRGSREATGTMPPFRSGPLCITGARPEPVCPRPRGSAARRKGVARGAERPSKRARCFPAAPPSCLARGLLKTHRSLQRHSEAPCLIRRPPPSPHPLRRNAKRCSGSGTSRPWGDSPRQRRASSSRACPSSPTIALGCCRCFSFASLSLSQQ